MSALRLVVFDLDGVLVDATSSWVYVHEHFGVNNDDAYYAYLRGEMDYAEFMRRDILLWLEKTHDLTPVEIADVLDQLPLMQGARETLRVLHSESIETAIVSCGIDLLANRVARELNIKTVHCNGLDVDQFGHLTGEGIPRVTLKEKGAPVAKLVEDLGISKEEAAAVGDSSSDSLMFDEVGFGIAFNADDGEVTSKADAVVRTKDLREILKVLRKENLMS